MKKIFFGITIVGIILIGAVFILTKAFRTGQADYKNVNTQVNKEQPTALDEKQAVKIVQGLLTTEQSVAQPAITIVKASDSYIKANVFYNPGGGYLLAAKVDGKWKKVIEGNGFPQCSDVMNYNFPSEIVSDCLQGEVLLAITSWEEAKSLVASCQVASVMQTHINEVTLKLKDGKSVHTIEPVIDEIIDLAAAAKDECGNILMSTE